MKRSLFVAVLLVIATGAMAAEMTGTARKQFDRETDTALRAYNREDARAFFTQFARRLEINTTAESFKSLYVNVYKKQFGNLVSRGDMIEDHSAFNEEAAVTCYEAEFTKVRDGRIVINWKNENGTYKIVMVEFQKNTR